MTAHRYHPDPEMGDPDVSWDAPVLFDDCDRCDEHAQRPWASLDAQHLVRLRDVIDGRLHPLTTNERLAAAALRESPREDSR